MNRIPDVYNLVKNNAYLDTDLSKYLKGTNHLKKQNAPELRKALWPVDWNKLTEKIRNQSIYKNYHSWKLVAYIVKSNDDIRQEKIVSQLISILNEIFQTANLPLKIINSDILVFNNNCGLIQYFENTQSFDALKQKLKVTSIAEVFNLAFADTIQEARTSFILSHAAYSLLSYLCAVKDRHNGNILLTKSGSVIHIDYSYIFYSSPGFVNFETAPFKLTSEILDVMGGVNSAGFDLFKELIFKGFVEMRKNAQHLLLMVKMMLGLEKLSCFNHSPATVIKLMEKRLFLNQTTECLSNIDLLIKNSILNWRSSQYDNYQWFTNGIL
uniref:Phosphatidylinositol 4-kinase beta 1-like n=1 Tax=Dermatophagoides pteronyssinus TaxID=6956 RepID=A0A6P6YBU1_DERPT|nr:phosphatidylinositol 4-kinase beta 1-like [Dermatophagoides pteronyssinus]